MELVYKCKNCYKIITKKHLFNEKFYCDKCFDYLKKNGYLNFNKKLTEF